MKKSCVGWLLVFALPLLCTVTLTGCFGKAAPALEAGFVPPNMMTSSSDLPFQKSWRKSGTSFLAYNEIYLAPVNIDHLSRMQWWIEHGGDEKFKKDAEDLALYARSALIDSFENDFHFKVVARPGPKTLILEMALVEIVPNKATLEALSYLAGPAGHVVSTLVGAAAKSVSKSSVAFEAQIRDGATGEIIAAYADRESEKGSIVNIKHFSWYGHARSILKEWAEQFTRVLNKREGEIIKDSSTFEIKPW